MKTLKIFILTLLLAIPLVACAQKKPLKLISDSLKSVTEELPVKVGPQWMGKIYKIKFGDYGVGESKMGWVVTTQKGSIFNRKTEGESKNKFSFELTGATSDVAHVNAIQTTKVEALREWIWLSYSGKHTQLSIENDYELLLQTNTLSAIITIRGDTTDIWTLIITTQKGSMIDNDYTPIALFTNGDQRIYFIPITSNENEKEFERMPSLGYKLVEHGLELAAFQFNGGGVWGANKNVVWLPKDNSPKMKLLLATAITTLLQTKIGQMEF